MKYSIKILCYFSIMVACLNAAIGFSFENFESGLFWTLLMLISVYFKNDKPEQWKFKE